MSKKNTRIQSNLHYNSEQAVHNKIIRVAIEAIKQSSVAGGNTTEKAVNLTLKAINLTENIIKLGLSIESSSALARVIYKTTREIVRGNKVCTILCIISGVCETLALCSSIMTFLPYRTQIYIGTKVVSRGCTSFRNLYAGEGC